MNKAASKANRILGLLKSTFVNRDARTWKKLYTVYVRPHVEFAISAWSPYLHKDVSTLEKVQRRATKFIRECKGQSYVERCKKLKLTTLEVRRIRGDLIQLFKIVKGIDEVEWFSTLLVAPNGRRTQLRREIVRGCNQRHNFFTNRTINIWNRLPAYIINAQSVNQFKNLLDANWNAAIGRL